MAPAALVGPGDLNDLDPVLGEEAHESDAEAARTLHARPAKQTARARPGDQELETSAARRDRERAERSTAFINKGATCSISWVLIPRITSPA